MIDRLRLLMQTQEEEVESGDRFSPTLLAVYQNSFASFIFYSSLSKLSAFIPKHQ